MAGFRYLLCTKHIAHEGQNYEHYHCVVQYKFSVLLSWDKLHGAHNEKATSSIQGNIKYCRCEDKKHKELGVTYELIDEIGSMKPRGGNWTVKHLREVDIDEVPAHLYNIYKKLKHENDGTYDLDNNDDKNVEVFYIQGPSGIGKSKFKAKEILKRYKDIYGSKYDKVKFRNEFWSGVHDDINMCVYDEFRDSHMEPSEFINFIDYSINSMNIKGTQVLNNYKIIVITSVQRLDNLYKGYVDRNGYESCKQWFRRIHLIDCYPSSIECIGQFLDRGEYKSYTNCYDECIAWKHKNGYF